LKHVSEQTETSVVPETVIFVERSKITDGTVTGGTVTGGTVTGGTVIGGIFGFRFGSRLGLGEEGEELMYISSN
jgi:hypothetical protein